MALPTESTSGYGASSGTASSPTTPTPGAPALRVDMASVQIKPKDVHSHRTVHSAGVEVEGFENRWTNKQRDIMSGLVNADKARCQDRKAGEAAAERLHEQSKAMVDRISEVARASDAARQAIFNNYIDACKRDDEERQREYNQRQEEIQPIFDKIRKHLAELESEMDAVVVSHEADGNASDLLHEHFERSSKGVANIHAAAVKLSNAATTTFSSDATDAASVELDTAFQLARDARKAVRRRHDNGQNAYRAQHANQAQNNDQA